MLGELSKITLRKNSREKRLARGRLSPLERREALTGLAFLSPWLVGFLVFTLIPTGATLIFTFTDLRLVQGQTDAVHFVGLQNYRTLWHDSQAWNALKVTLSYALLALPVGVIVPVGLALVLNSPWLVGKDFFRSLFYLPYIIPFVSTVFIWGGMLNPENGWINRLLLALGVADPPNWQYDPRWVYPALVLIGIWSIGNDLLINLAGLKGVPTELYDAARVDGAGWWASLWHVTLPMISPVIFYSVTLTTIGLFQYFLVPLVVYNGSGAPGGATLFLNLYIYKTFFTFQNMSYGATLAWMLFMVILVITAGLFAAARRWVYYAGEGR